MSTARPWCVCKCVAEKINNNFTFKGTVKKKNMGGRHPFLSDKMFVDAEWSVPMQGLSGEAADPSSTARPSGIFKQEIAETC